ncbi:response regulator, partial [Pseudanabaenaceae cyanobacterium LEGE 13415]|nr:response regulator [Pseudanabaenaceae cyanobacterium LEGE 13415]
MAALMRSYDWANTPLGPVENWSPTLRSLVSTILASRFPQAIFWGDDYLQFYNDVLIPMYGAKHPKALGQCLSETFPEIWDDQMKPMMDGVRNTGEALYAEDLLYQHFRFGYLEECYFTFCYSPIRDEMGRFRGVLCTTTNETTQQVLNRRRLTMLRDLAIAGGGAKTLQSACTAAANTLNPYDIPFALFYQINSQNNLAELVAVSGLTPNSAAAPQTVALSSNDSEWRLAEVFQSGEPQLITDVIDRFGALSVEPWSESPDSAFILPIRSSNKAQIECLLVAGISARLRFNAEYQSFLELVAQQVESAIAIAQSYEEERKRAEALAELDRAKTAFFSNVSHEFRTPLTLMMSPAEELLADPDLLASHRQRIELIQRNGVQLLKLVNTLLDFTRIQSDRVSAVYEPTDLASFTADLASVFRSAIEQANLRYVVDCSSLSEAVYVDREMWEKIVLNLISNAFKFTFSGAIAVRLQQRNEQIELTVEDTGIGIPEAEISHLFERFYRVRNAQGRTFEGSGIGLSLVQELVKLHGGTIQVSSTERKGSCFCVSIPLGSDHLPNAQIQTTQTGTSRSIEVAYVEEALRWLPEQNLGTQIENPLDSNIQTRNLKVLLVDDNVDMRNYVKRLLSTYWQVETATNGTIALQSIAQNPPDLVLSDVMMPELDGFGLLQAIRANPLTQSIPVILLSARAGEESTIDGLEAGADDYLIKPFSARELIARVETHLQLARLRQEQSTNRFKTEFLLTVTHELQAPLVAILGWARLLRSRSFDADTLERALATIERNAANEAKLVRDLLDVSNLLAGKLRLNVQVVNLIPLLQSVTANLRELADRKQVRLLTTLSNVTQGTVLADGDRIQQIITILLENAIKFTPEGGQVTLSLECYGTEIQIIVSDTGIGITPEFLPYVFDRFTQAEVPSRHSPGGVGIGLAIARRLVELHHGTIEAKSEGQGSTFIVRLPVLNSTDARSLE